MFPKIQHRTDQSYCSTERGFMLMEVLVSILIFSVGVLALVGLQAKLTKAQGASKFRTDASYLAQEIIGQMWSDIPNAQKYATNCATYQPCQDWVGKVSQALPAGTGSVSYSAADDSFTITVIWSAGSDGHSYTTTTTLQAAGSAI